MATTWGSTPWAGYDLTPAEAARWDDAMEVWGLLQLCEDRILVCKRAQQRILAEFEGCAIDDLPSVAFDALTRYQDEGVLLEADRARYRAMEWTNPLAGADARHSGARDERRRSIDGAFGRMAGARWMTAKGAA